MGIILPLDMPTLVVARIVSVVIIALGVTVMTLRRDQRETQYFCLALVVSIAAWFCLVGYANQGPALSLVAYAGLISASVSLQWAAFACLMDRPVPKAWFVISPVLSVVFSLGALPLGYSVGVVSAFFLSVQLAGASVFAVREHSRLVSFRTSVLIATGYCLTFLAAALRVIGAILAPETAGVETFPMFADTLTFILSYIGTIILTLSWLAALKDRAEASLAQMAFHDVLTGLSNRRYLYEHGEVLWARARRQGTVFTMVLLDIDHFKLVNDRFGHVEGDRVLRALGELMTFITPRPEIAARIGGEEFCMVFAGVDARQAHQVCEDLRLNLADRIQLPDGQPVRFSAGIATSGPADDSMASVYSRADKALYEAKSSGRDCAVMAPALPLVA